MAFKDRQIDKFLPFSLRDFQHYAHLRRSIDEWAEQVAELMATRSGHKCREVFRPDFKSALGKGFRPTIKRIYKAPAACFQAALKRGRP